MVLDVLRLLPVPLRLLEGLDDQGSGTRHDGDLSLAILDRKLDGDAEALPVFGSLFSDIFTDLFGGEAKGAVADAVVDGRGKSGAAGAGGLGTEEDLGRKKAEQAPLREAITQERKHDVDVGGVLGQRGGPANPVP